MLPDVDCVEFHTWWYVLNEKPIVLLYFFIQKQWNSWFGWDALPWGRLRKNTHIFCRRFVFMSWLMVAWIFLIFHWFHKGFAIYSQEKTLKAHVLHNCCAKTSLHVCKLDLVMSWSITCINWPQQITWFACCQNTETCLKVKHVKVFVNTNDVGWAFQRIAPHKEAPQRAPKRTGQSYDLMWIGECYWALT